MLQFHEMGNHLPGIIEEVMKEDGIQEFTVNQTF